MLRFFGSYGPRQPLSWWGGPQSVFIDAVLNDREIPIHGDGLQTRSFTYVSDTVDGIYAAMKPEANGRCSTSATTRNHDPRPGQTHQGGHRHRRAPEVLVPYESFTGRNYEDVRRRVPDTSLAQRFLGVRAHVGLDEGLRRTIDWQRGTRDRRFGMQDPERRCGSASSAAASWA